MATSTALRPVGVAPETFAPPVHSPDRLATQAAAADTGAIVHTSQPPPAVLSALHWNAAFGPWVQGHHNFRPVIEDASARARSRVS